MTTGFFGLYSYFMTQLDMPNRQTTPMQHTRVLGSSFRCLDKEGKRPQNFFGLIFFPPDTRLYIRPPRATNIAVHQTVWHIRIWRHHTSCQVYNCTSRRHLYQSLSRRQSNISHFGPFLDYLRARWALGECLVGFRPPHRCLHAIVPMPLPPSHHTRSR